MSDRQKIVLAFLASLLIHIAIVVAIMMWSVVVEILAGITHLPLTQATQQPAKPADLSQLTVTLMPSPPPKIALAPVPKPTPLEELDSDGLMPSKKAPVNAAFQSDSNMIAGSELPALGNIPLPSEAGKRRNFVDFANIAPSMGKGQTPGGPPARPTQASAAPPLPEQTPAAVTKVEARPSDHTAQATPTPKPAPSAPPDSFTIGTPTPTPQPAPVAELAKLSSPPPLRAQPDIAPMVRQPSNQPPAPPSAEPSTQRELDKTEIEGGITAQGQPGVDAVETPYGRYHRKLSNIIGSRWNLYLQEHPKDVGDVTILFTINTSGKVTGTRVISNHSLDDLAELSTKAIVESDLPPVPDDLAPMLRDGKLEITFHFDVYDPNNDPGR